ncbi:unnamed protein product, partial [Phaeothamnion confervicola]
MVKTRQCVVMICATFLPGARPLVVPQVATPLFLASRSVVTACRLNMLSSLQRQGEVVETEIDDEGSSTQQSEGETVIGGGGTGPPLTALGHGPPRVDRSAKVRQHVNPLAALHQRPATLPADWYQQLFPSPDRPLHVDIGCARGRFVRDMAAKHAATNFLGLEIRRPVVATAVDRAVRAGLPNCAFLACNANVDFDRIMADAAAAGATLGTVSIQFPDPHFKARHHKRRVLQPALVAAIQRWLRPGGSLFMQGDVLPVVEEMRAIVRE